MRFLIDRIKDFFMDIKETKGAGVFFLICITPVILVIFYIVGAIGGFAANMFMSLSLASSDNLPSFSLAPGTVISSYFKYPFLILVGLFFTVPIVFKILTVCSFYTGRGELDKDRNLRISGKGIYGTAKWASLKDLIAKKLIKVTAPEDADGCIFGQVDSSNKKIISKNLKSQTNNHVAVFGSSGSGKTRCYVKNCIIQSVKNEESLIVTDPKGELFEDTAQYLRDNGYVVKILNLVKPEKSDSWNCLKEIRGDELRAQVFADTIIKNTGDAEGFWDNSEMNLLKALILRVSMGESFAKQNIQSMGEVYDLLVETGGEFGVDRYFNKNDVEADGAKACLAPYSIFKQAPDNTRASIVGGLGTRLQVFQNAIIKKLTEYNDMDLTLPGKKKCAYFCIMSDQNSALNFLSSLFFSFLFIDLVEYADESGGKCDIPVNFVLDEFPNIGQIVDFTKKISTVRSRGLNISVIFQAVSQLENRYPMGAWSEILGNCDTHLFLGCNDPDTADFISKRTGESTIKVGSKRMARNSSIDPFYNQGIAEVDGEGKRQLMTMDEVMKMDLADCLIILRGNEVLRAKKYNYDSHPESYKFKHVFIKQYPSIAKQSTLSIMEKRSKDLAGVVDETSINELIANRNYCLYILDKTSTSEEDRLIAGRISHIIESEAYDIRQKAANIMNDEISNAVKKEIAAEVLATINSVFNFNNNSDYNTNTYEEESLFNYNIENNNSFGTTEEDIILNIDASNIIIDPIETEALIIPEVEFAGNEPVNTIFSENRNSINQYPTYESADTEYININSIEEIEELGDVEVEEIYNQPKHIDTPSVIDVTALNPISKIENVKPVTHKSAQPKSVDNIELQKSKSVRKDSDTLYSNDKQIQTSSNLNNQGNSFNDFLPQNNNQGNGSGKPGNEDARSKNLMRDDITQDGKNFANEFGFDLKKNNKKKKQTIISQTNNGKKLGKRK